jgi:hypothetical protein
MRGGLLFVVLFVACKSTNNTPADVDAATNDAGDGGGDCVPAKGIYGVTYTANPGNAATCIGADQLTGDEAFDPADKDGAGCNATLVGCTKKVHCQQTIDGGATATIDLERTAPSAGADSFTGSYHIVVTGADAGQDCAYTFDGKKK